MANDPETVLTPTATTEVTISFQATGAVLSLGVGQIGFNKAGDPIGVIGKLWHGSFLLSRETLLALKSVVDATVTHMSQDEYKTSGELQITRTK